ncbi:hypothetical protein L2E82_00473 [Cichorium intybus]|uniref:Uncharacterized protein n=1 Tax=Cichorium intybus TaxID=13427 RepID=A0ACB9GXM9_CICIN|nr:hypothetical protein L2E82_00473 [Cichorium intybus]
MIGERIGDSSQDTAELVDVNTSAEIAGNGGGSDVSCEQTSLEEPCVGMEFDSEDAAKKFYDEYARHAGFKMRIDQCRRSEDCKERRIQALTAELKHQDRLINFYREHLNTFLRDIEQQTEVLSTKIQVVVNNVREIETKEQKR